MADNVGSKVTYFLVGLGVGALVGILFAPKSGEDTREFLSKKADEGRDYAQKKAKELRERADDLIERSKDAATARARLIVAKLPSLEPAKPGSPGAMMYRGGRVSERRGAARHDSVLLRGRVGRECKPG
jgi:hypothetical protein